MIGQALLGDGTYVHFDNGDIVLSDLSDHGERSDIIVLTPTMLATLGLWIRTTLPPEFHLLLTGGKK